MCNKFLTAVLVFNIMKLSGPFQLCQSAVPGLTDFLQVTQTWDAALLSGVQSTVFAAIIVEKRHLLQKVKNGTEQSQSKGWKLPAFINFSWWNPNLSERRINWFVFVYLKLTHPEEVVIPQSVDEMPPLSSLLLSVILKYPSITRYTHWMLLI